VAEVADLLIRNKWRTGETTRHLAEKWGCTVQHVRNVKSETMRTLSADLAVGASELRTQLIMYLEEQRAAAMAMVKPMVCRKTTTGEGKDSETVTEYEDRPFPDIRAANDAVRHAADLLGLTVTRVEVNDVSERVRQLAGMSTDDRVRLLEGMIEKLRAVEGSKALSAGS